MPQSLELGRCSPSVDQKLHPCAFFSRQLTPAERNYGVGNRELLAVVLALKEWRHWLEGASQPFLAWSDHKNLSYLRSARRLNSRLSLLQQRFWWPSVTSDTRGFVLACSVCARNKASHRAPAGQLRPLPIPHRPWSHIAVDFVTGLPPSEGNSVILTIIDRFSKSAHFVPLPKLPSALETANLLIQHVFRLHGLPQDIVSDRGPQFTSRVWRAFCQAIGATASLS